jgi:hypothetical protein
VTEDSLVLEKKKKLLKDFNLKVLSSRELMFSHRVTARNEND